MTTGVSFVYSDYTIEFYRNLWCGDLASKKL